MKLPDGGATGLRTDDDVRRRRALSMAYTGAIGLGSAASTTKVLGG